MKKGIYLAAFKAQHPGHEIIYQDINGKRDIDGDMMNVNIKQFDYIIATPPCNYYSRGNYRREKSKYSQQTKHLLPEIIDKLCKQEKPFIVENVRNSKIYQKLGLYDKPCFIYMIGRHTYWTNIIMTSDIEQIKDDIQNKTSKNRQGGFNVHNVIEQFIQFVEQI